MSKDGLVRKKGQFLSVSAKCNSEVLSNNDMPIWNEACFLQTVRLIYKAWNFRRFCTASLHSI